MIYALIGLLTCFVITQVIYFKRRVDGLEKKTEKVAEPVNVAPAASGSRDMFSILYGNK